MPKAAPPEALIPQRSPWELCLLLLASFGLASETGLLLTLAVATRPVQHLPRYWGLRSWLVEGLPLVLFVPLLQDILLCLLPGGAVGSQSWLSVAVNAFKIGLFQARLPCYVLYN